MCLREDSAAAAAAARPGGSADGSRRPPSGEGAEEARQPKRARRDDPTEDAPLHLVCSVSLEVMTNPVLLDTKCGHSFAQKSIEEMLRSGAHRCPKCREPVRSTDLIPNRELRCAVEEYLAVRGGEDSASAASHPADDAEQVGGSNASSPAFARPNSSDGGADGGAAAGASVPRGIRMILDDIWGLYEGELSPEGRMHGIGTFRADDGSVYTGQFRGGSPHGHGSASWPSGNTYVGSVRNGKRDGHGVYKWPSGAHYEGEWKQNKKHGTGTSFFSDGGSYEGEWKEGKWHGQGVVKSSDGAIEERGRYENDEFVGE